MTKYEYLAELEKNLDMLSYDDKTQALEYYENYIEDAGKENLQQVLEQLGSPAELAKSIFNGIPGVLANLPPINKDEYNREAIKSIDAKFGACRVLVEEGEEFNVEQKNMGTNKVDIKISKDGVLSITNKENIIGIFSTSILTCFLTILIFGGVFMSDPKYEHHLSLKQDKLCPFRFKRSNNLHDSVCNWHANIEILLVTDGEGYMQYNSDEL